MQVHFFRSTRMSWLLTPSMFTVVKFEMQQPICFLGGHSHSERKIRHTCQLPGIIHLHFWFTGSQTGYARTICFLLSSYTYCGDGVLVTRCVGFLRSGDVIFF